MASSLIIRIGADLSALAQSLKKAENRLKRFSFKAERIGRDLTTRVSLPILAIGGAAVKSFADFDKMEKGLSAIAGSAAEGARQFKDLLALVKDTRTTLDLSTAANASLQLQSVGLSASNAKRLLQGFGLAATVSGKGVEDVGGAVRQFTQVLAKGSIEQEDFITIAERIPFIGNLIRNELGFKTAEEIRESGISMDSFVEKVTVAAEKSSVLARASGGLSGAFTALNIGVQEAAVTFGGAIAKALSLEENLTKLGDAIGGLADKFANLNPATQKFIVFAAATVAAVGPLTLGLGAAARAIPLLSSGFKLLVGPIGGAIGLMKGFSGFVALLIPGGGIARVAKFSSALIRLGGIMSFITSPVTLIVAAIAILTIAFINAYKNSQTFRQQIARLGQAFRPIVTAVKDLAKKYFPNLSDAFSSVGNAFNFVFALIAGGISFVIEGIIAVVDTVKNTAGAIIDFFSGDFSAAGEKLSKTLFNPATFTATAGRAAEAAVKVFNETLEGEPISVPSFALPTEPSFKENDDKPTAVGKGGGKKTAADQLDFFDATAITEFTIVLRAAEENTKFLQERLEGLKATVGNSDIFAPYREGLELITEKQLAFGDTYDGLSAKIDLTKSTINSLIEDGFSAQSGVVELATDELREYLEELEKFNRIQGIVNTISGAVAKLSGIVTSNLEKGVSAFKGLGKAAIFAARDIIASQIRIAVVTQITKALASVPFPFNVGIAAAAGAGIEGLVKAAITSISVPFLAEGGITQGAGLFVAGEAGPEAIIPLDRLNEFMRPSGGMVSGVLRADGNELIAVINTVEQQNSRSF